MDTTCEKLMCTLPRKFRVYISNWCTLKRWPVSKNAYLSIILNIQRVECTMRNTTLPAHNKFPPKNHLYKLSTRPFSYFGCNTGWTSSVPTHSMQPHPCPLIKSVFFQANDHAASRHPNRARWPVLPKMEVRHRILVRARFSLQRYVWSTTTFGDSGRI